LPFSAVAGEAGRESLVRIGKGRERTGQECRERGRDSAGRPVDMEWLKDGSMLLFDDYNGAVYRGPTVRNFQPWGHHSAGRHKMTVGFGELSSTFAILSIFEILLISAI
jgi:hypothetical protein